jgi:hypothetical protein
MPGNMGGSVSSACFNTLATALSVIFSSSEAVHRCIQVACLIPALRRTHVLRF